MNAKKILPAFLLAAILIPGCKRMTDNDFVEHRLKPEMYFDFKTNDTVCFDLNYGPQGSGALIEMFAQDPYYIDPYGSIFKNEYVKPVYKYFADANGVIDIRAKLPSYVQDSLFLCSDAYGVPQCMVGHIVKGKVYFNYEDLEKTQEESKGDEAEPQQTKVTWNPYFITADYWTATYGIVNWSGGFGAISDYNQVLSTNYNATRNSQISQIVRQGRTRRWTALDNSRYANKDQSLTNIVIPKETSAQVFVTLVDECTSNQNVLAYYFYPSDNVPKNASGLEEYIFVPNFSIPGSYPYTTGSEMSLIKPYNSGRAPISVSKNNRIQLLYKDSWGRVSTTFPGGTTIGFCFLQDGYQSGNIFHAGSMNYSAGRAYSNKDWNSNSNPRFMTRTTDNYVIYGVEDGSDKTFDDMVFIVSSSPENAIINKNNDPVTPIINDIKDTVTSFCTYCFEDLWPYRGDYDMNDVVVEHYSEVGFDKNNYVLSIMDRFTVCNRASSASLKNAFGVVIPPYMRGDMVLPNGAVDENVIGGKMTNAVILFKDAGENIGKSFTISRIFSPGQLTRTEYEASDIDPFIIPKVDNIGYTDDLRREVHLPKHEGTSKINKQLYGTAQDAYFIDQDGKHPFSVCIPLSVTKGEYTLPAEESCIEDEYPDFAKWAESRGTTNKDWYLYYHKSKR